MNGCRATKWQVVLVLFATRCIPYARGMSRILYGLALITLSPHKEAVFMRVDGDTFTCRGRPVDLIAYTIWSLANHSNQTIDQALDIIADQGFNTVLVRTSSAAHRPSTPRQELARIQRRLPYSALGSFARAEAVLCGRHVCRHPETVRRPHLHLKKKIQK